MTFYRLIAGAPLFKTLDSGAIGKARIKRVMGRWHVENDFSLILNVDSNIKWNIFPVK